MRKLFFLIVFLSCSGCLYKCSSPNEFAHRSVSIPYVEGDSYGQLTEALVYQISSSGPFEYKQKLSDYRLEVAIVSLTNDKIGYKKELKKKCNDSHKKSRTNLLPVESRENIAAQVLLRSNLCGDVVWGPKVITADIDYDYSEQDSTKDLSFVGKNGDKSILTFSLGQLETVSTAQDSALRPLYQKLAKNIASALNGELNIQDF